MNTIKLLFSSCILMMSLNTTIAQDKDNNVQKTKKAFMGVTLGTSWGDGVEISEISKNYGAERAGLKEGDIITAINEDPVSTKDAFTKILSKYRAGEEVTVAYLRGKDKASVKVKLAESPYGFSISNGDWNWNWNGNVDDLKVKLKKKEKAILGIYPKTNWEERAILIEGFTENSAAKEAGLKKGDFILKIANEEINTEEELRYTMSKYKPNESVEVQFKRDGKIDKKTVKLGMEKVIDWDNFNISVSDDDDDARNSNEPSRTWSSYTFADGTEVTVNDFMVAPATVTDKAEISFSTNLKKAFSVVLYNSQGKEVTRKDDNTASGKFAQTFDLTQVPAGEYFIKIWMDGKEVFSQKMDKR